MPELFTDLNKWLLDHQALVVTFGIPLLTALSAAIVSLVTTKANLIAQRKQRLLQVETQLCQFRQIWIDALRDDLSLCANLAARFQEDHANVQVRSELVGIISRVRMRISLNDPDDEELTKAFAKALGASQEFSEWDENTETISIVGQRMLKREWERLKLDLRAIERGHQ